ncbi:MULTISPECIES: HpcH/HpaI aldolase/citrate lyase family protein [Rhodococcus]|uniref:Citrate lyase beta chain n=1 Tax=Rhodococcus pyridinivorans AK37 TaxID=1114960 RepID=H0JUD3_9NOCA|nr:MULTISPECIES: aldolase/citrate lyase family protein [Rhodococcus]EHK82231.1 citrate lyase beta chain [Rhodococcus pyridinivorans AK37]
MNDSHESSRGGAERDPSNTADQEPISSEYARSWLLVPATQAAELPLVTADRLVLDLEDGVPIGQRSHARQVLRGWANNGGQAWVRINPATTADWCHDLETIQDCVGIRGVVLAKTEYGSEIGRTTAALNGSREVIALIETAVGVLNLREITQARPTRLALGSGDFSRDTRAKDGSPTLTAARVAMVFSSAAAGLPAPIDGPTLSGDEATILHRCSQARDLGMGGKLCLRDSDAKIVNRGFSPSQDEIYAALQLVNQSADKVDGSYPPRRKRAQAILNHAGALNLL